MRPISDYVTLQMITSYYKGLKRGLGRSEAQEAIERMARELVRF